MKNLILGIDVSKDKIDYVILSSDNHKIIDKGVVLNDRKSLSLWLKEFDVNDIEFALEHTGHYGALLSWLLSEIKACYYLINPLEIKRSLGVQRGKTDTIDAYRIASYAISHNHKLEPFQLPTQDLRKLKALMAARERYTKISVQLQNSLKANLILSETIDVKSLIKEEKRQLKSVKNAIAFVDKEMKEIIDNSEVLRCNYNKITQVVGVGPITAIRCITVTDNFSKFPNGRKFSCYSGLAPFPYQSGSSVKGRTKTHHLRNKQLKSVLFKAAGTAIQHDQQLRQYYHRKTKEGKHKLTVLNAVANKIVLRIFAVVNREEPFVKLSA